MIENQKNSTRSDLYIERLTAQHLQTTKSRFELDQSFDKYLLTFSTGTLYLSLNFFKDLMDNNPLLYLLIIGWVFLVLSMMASLGSLFYSRKSYKYLEGYLNSEIKRENDLKDNCVEGCDCNRYCNKYDNYIVLLELFSLWGFIIGVVLAGVFYVCSIIN